MKELIVFLWLIVGFYSYSQEEGLTVVLDDFTEVKGFDGLSINLIAAYENKAVISGEDVSSVVIVNNDGVLKIRMKILKIFSGYKTFVDVYYAQNLDVIDVNEDSKITNKGVINQDIIELRAQEGGELNIQANVEQLLIKAVTGGIIKASGEGNVQDVQVNTGGLYKGKDFLSKLTTINVNAGSKAQIFAINYVKAMVKAGGEVQVYGNPERIDEKTIFGGVIKRMN